MSDWLLNAFTALIVIALAVAVGVIVVVCYMIDSITKR